MVFWLKSPYYDSQNNRKKHVFKTSPRQNQTTILTKKYI